MRPSVESFSQVATGCDEHLPGAGFQVGKLINHGYSHLLAQATLEDKALHSACREASHNPLEMLRPLRQDERVTSPSVRSNDIGTDLRGSVVVVNDPANGLLNTKVQAIAFSVVGLVHDEIELERFSPRVLFRRVVSRCHSSGSLASLNLLGPVLCGRVASAFR